jgi:hypothetical protein
VESLWNYGTLAQNFVKPTNRSDNTKVVEEHKPQSFRQLHRSVISIFRKSRNYNVLIIPRSFAHPLSGKRGHNPVSLRCRRKFDQLRTNQEISFNLCLASAVNERLPLHVVLRLEDMKEEDNISQKNRRQQVRQPTRPEEPERRLTSIESLATTDTQVGHTEFISASVS